MIGSCLGGVALSLSVFHIPLEFFGKSIQLVLLGMSGNTAQPTGNREGICSWYNWQPKDLIVISIPTTVSGLGVS